MVNSCTYNGNSYSHGATICSNNKEIICDNGSWQPTGKDCSEELENEFKLSEEIISNTNFDNDIPTNHFCRIGYEGMCGIGAAGQKVYVYNNSQNISYKVLIQITERTYIETIWRNLTPLTGQHLGCTLSGQNNPKTYVILKAEEI